MAGDMATTNRLGDPHLHFESLDSTMRVAAERAEQGAPEGLLVTADRQTAGRGRLGRSWMSDAGLGLYLSLVLRPPVAPADSLALTLASGLGVSRGIGRICGVKCDIRWPNDVLIGERKLAGVLVEMTANHDRVRHVVVGVGVNVNHESMPGELQEIATSLRMETDCEWARDLLLAAVIEDLERYYAMFLERGTPAIVEAFTRASTYVKGKRVRIEGAGEDREGVTAGLDEAGMLLLEDAGGIRPVVAGSVRPI